MGLVDKLKSIVGSTEEETEAEYKCQTCQATYDEVREVCEACGGNVVEVDV